MSLPVPDPAFRWSVEPWGHALRCQPLEDDAQHLFTTRQLELRALPATAWAHAALSLGAGVQQVVRLTQVHGRTIHVLRKGERGRDVDARPEADALISNDGALVLAVQVADCVPVLMADRRRGAAAAVHAGWRGTRARIVAAAVEAMAHEFGTTPADLTVAIGPSIGACCYEVGAEVFEAFHASGANEAELAAWFTRGPTGSLRLDLWAANRDQLRAAGVSGDQIFVARLCTQTHVDVFDSYRAAGVSAGRMAGLIRVPS